MSELDHDDDRDLDAFLNRQSPVSQAWREAAGPDRAPDALDAAILAAAAETRPVLKPKPAPRLRRWRLPIGLAASLLVGVGVLREAQRDERAREQLLGESAAVAAQASQRVVDQAAQRSAFDDVAPRAAAQAAEQRREAEPERRMPSAAMAAAEPPPAFAAVAPPPPLPAPLPPPSPAAPVVSAAAIASSPLPAPAAEAEADAMPVEPREGWPGPAQRKAVAPPPAAAAATAPAVKRAVPVQPSSAPAATGWQPARYRDLALGQATVDDTLRRHGAPEVDTEARSNEAPMPDGRRAQRLLDYGRGLDPRGRVRLYFDATRMALAWVNLVLDPPLPLAAVQAAEGLAGDGLPRAADAPPCDAQPTPPGEPAWPQIRSWPGQGVQLLLAGPDRVVEISYLERCQ